LLKIIDLFSFSRLLYASSASIDLPVLCLRTAILFHSSAGGSGISYKAFSYASKAFSGFEISRT